jgi:hypothetical protein
VPVRGPLVVAGSADHLVRFDVAHRLRLIGVTTVGGASMFGAAVLFASNCAGLRNIALQPLQAWNGVSYLTPVLRSTVTRWKRSKPQSRQRHCESVMAGHRSQASRWVSMQYRRTPGTG